MLARGRIERQRTPGTVDDDQRRRKRVLQAGDDPLVHAILLRMTRPSAGHACEQRRLRRISGGHGVLRGEMTSAPVHPPRPCLQNRPATPPVPRPADGAGAEP